jgi:hypothetical protein
MPTAVEYAVSNQWNIHQDVGTSVEHETAPTPTLSDGWLFAAPLVVLLLVMAAAVAVRTALPVRFGARAGCG